jgi:hypothetical protein
MTIPLPGAGVVYSALKDFWSWVSTRLRGRRLTPDVFRGWTVDEWYRPHGDAPKLSRWPERLDQIDEDQYCADLKEQLTMGELIARGFREPLSHGAPYLTISRHEWRVIELKLPDRAEGGGIGYVGLTIGKPGTKRLLRRGR